MAVSFGSSRPVPQSAVAPLEKHAACPGQACEKSYHECENRGRDCCGFDRGRRNAQFSWKRARRHCDGFPLRSIGWYAILIFVKRCDRIGAYRPAGGNLGYVDIEHGFDILTQPLLEGRERPLRIGLLQEVEEIVPDRFKGDARQQSGQLL